MRMTFSEMNCTATLVLTLVLTLGVYDGFCMLDESKAYLEPENQVRKVGDKGQFKCRSPAGYSSTSPDISFILEHNGTLIDKRKEADKRTDGKFDWAIFKIMSLKREDAGTYKCIIGGGVNVTAESKLFVIEDDHRPIFVKDGDSSTVKCFNSTSLGFVPYVECLWGDKKICHDKVSCCSIKAEKDNALKPVTCKVTSKAAFNKNKRFDNQSSTELKKEVSVVSWNACEEFPCTLKANVYGVTPVTPVQISWSMAGINISSTEEESSSMINSTTDPINSTGVVLLTVSGGGAKQSWNISMATKEDSKDLQSKDIIGIVLGSVSLVVIVLIVLLIYWCKYRKTNEQQGIQQGDMTGTGQSKRMPESMPLTARSGANNGEQPTKSCTV